MLSAWTTMILVQSFTALGDTTTQDTLIANHENKYWTDLFFVRHPYRDSNLGTRPQWEQIDTLDRSAKDPRWTWVSLSHTWLIPSHDLQQDK